MAFAEVRVVCVVQFFFRKLKPSARPIAQSEAADVAVSAADCRLSAFASIDDATRCWIKVRGHGPAPWPAANASVETPCPFCLQGRRKEGGGGTRVALLIARLPLPLRSSAAILEEPVDKPANSLAMQGRKFSVAGLLADGKKASKHEDPLAPAFEGGSMFIFRLAPQVAARLPSAKVHIHDIATSAVTRCRRPPVSPESCFMAESDGCEHEVSHWEDTLTHAQSCRIMLALCLPCC